MVKPNCFGRSISDKELDDAPKNMKKSTSWGVGVWSAWCAERDITKDIFHMTTEELDYRYHISRFVQELLREMARLILQIRLLYHCSNTYWRLDIQKCHFLMRTILRFLIFGRYLDAHMNSEDISTERKSAEPITQEMESIFWETEIFSVSKSDGLLNAIYFYNSVD